MLVKKHGYDGHLNATIYVRFIIRILFYFHRERIDGVLSIVGFIHRTQVTRIRSGVLNFRRNHSIATVPTVVVFRSEPVTRLCLPKQVP